MGSFKKIPIKYLWYSIFILLPMVLLIVSQWEMSIRGPYFERQNSDPEYAYLLNGLKLVNGQSPNHVDHPGTTLQVLTAVVIDFRHAIKDFLVVRTPTSEDVLQHPEAYLHTIRDFMAIGIAILYFFIAVQVYNKTKLAWAAIGFQLFPFLSTSLIHALARVSVEPFLIITMLLGTILLVEVTEKKQPVYPIWQPILMGLILGVGLVTKLTFLPFLLLVLWFPRLRDRILVITTCIGSFFLLTIPIWSRANYFISWVTVLVTKQGEYGSGSNGFLPPFQTLMSNLIDLVRVEPFYFIILAILILWCILSWKSRTPENQLERLRVSLSIGILVIQLIMVMKFSRSYYMITGLTWLGFIFLMGILKLQSIFSIGSTNYKVFRTALFSMLIGLAVMNTFTFFSSTQSTIGKEHLETKKIDVFIQTNYSSCSIIRYYGALDLPSALSFGNDFAGGYFAESLIKLYPDTFMYNIWSRAFTSFGGGPQDDEIQKRLSRGECILLRGGGDLNSMNNSFDIAQLDPEKIIVKSERVYRLRAKH